jgi:hypothetical protein
MFLRSSLGNYFPDHYSRAPRSRWENPSVQALPSHMCAHVNPELANWSENNASMYHRTKSYSHSFPPRRCAGSP